MKTANKLYGLLLLTMSSCNCIGQVIDTYKKSIDTCYIGAFDILLPNKQLSTITFIAKKLDDLIFTKKLNVEMLMDSLLSRNIVLLDDPFYLQTYVAKTNTKRDSSFLLLNQENLQMFFAKEDSSLTFHHPIKKGVLRIHICQYIGPLLYLNDYTQDDINYSSISYKVYKDKVKGMCFPLGGRINSLTKNEILFLKQKKLKLK